MNKRYIDFVPVDRRGAASTTMVRRPAAKKPVVRKPVVREPVVKQVEEERPIIRRVEPTTTFSRNTGGVSTRKSAEFGVIEDYHPKFVQAEVKKRPLGAKNASQRSVRVVSGAGATGVRRPVARTASTPKVVTRTMARSVAPAGAIQANFINVGKVEKRPLSKNVYARKTPTTTVQKEKAKEASKKPTVIIAKPEKDSKVGLIVAVILTIILGAAAGTVAFLLLPK